MDGQPINAEFRQRFPHFIPRADDIVPSALPKLKEVPFEFRKTCGIRKDV